MNKSKSIWLFRSNLRILEDYHKTEISSIEEFENICPDFWLLQLIEFLRQDGFDEAVVWRLYPPDNNKDLDTVISFIINNKTKKLYQRFVDSFEDIFNPFENMYNHCTPEFTLFRGGFPEYDLIVNKYKKFLGKTLYCGAGKRIYPQYRGSYDLILVEDTRDINDKYKCIPFYKTASPNHFYMNDTEPIHDICFIANFSQQKYKGQEFFIKEVSESEFLQSLKIIHIGNNEEIGKELCKKYNVTNIKFEGYKPKQYLNKIINQSKFGLICSNQNDGCPRVITEILLCGTPIIIRDSTRLLNYYKSNGVVGFFDNEVEKVFRIAMSAYPLVKEQAISGRNKLSLQNICKKNMESWKRETCI